MLFALIYFLIASIWCGIVFFFLRKETRYPTIEEDDLVISILCGVLFPITLPLVAIGFIGCNVRALLEKVFK